MGQVAQRYPEDKEASILYALILSSNFDPTDKKYTNQFKAAEILEPISKAQPDHPGVAHYLIHTYDYPALAPKGLDAARRYGKLAADAPHALHMPSHIFTRVGAWKESIESNTASAKAGTDKTFDKWHAYDYMVYAHLQLGQEAAARKVIYDAQTIPTKVDNLPDRVRLQCDAGKVRARTRCVGRSRQARADTCAERLSMEQAPAGRSSERVCAWSWRRGDQGCGASTSGSGAIAETTRRCDWLLGGAD